MEMKLDYSDISFQNNGKLKLLIIVGTRPEIIRLAAVITKCRQYFDTLLAHTGQNYDYNLNGVFFHDLQLEDPDVYMEAVGKDLGETIGKDMLNNPSECALAVWQGKVLMSIRHENEKRCRAFVVSNSGYSGWSEPAFFGNMPDPVCMGSMDHTADALYHVNCASTHARDHVTVKISRDCFATYTALMVDADNGGYADLAVDDQIFVLYERNYGQDGLYFTVLEKPDYA